MRTLRNPIYLLVVLAQVNLAAMVAGLATFMGKFIERQFAQTASFSNLMMGELFKEINYAFPSIPFSTLDAPVCVCVYVYMYIYIHTHTHTHTHTHIRGGTVHRCHGSVCTSVRGHGSIRIRYNREKNKSTMLCIFSFVLKRQ